MEASTTNLPSFTDKLPVTKLVLLTCNAPAMAALPLAAVTANWLPWILRLPVMRVV